MNLGLLASSIGQRMALNTSSSSTRDGAAVREFLTIRHNQLWDSFLWKDSIIEFVLSLSTTYSLLGNYMPTKNRVILPTIIQRVLGTRLGHRSLDIQSPMLFYRANYGEFFHIGFVCEYELLPSCVWEFDTPQNVFVVNNNAADNNVTITLDELQPDGVTVNRVEIATTTTGTAAGTTDRIDNFIKPVTQGSVYLAYQNGTVLGANLIPNGATYAITTYDVSGLISIGNTYTITWGTNEVSFTYGVAGNLILINNPGVGQQTTITIPVGNSEAKFGNIGPADLPVTATLQQVLPNYVPINTLTASQTQASKSQRIQLIGKPTAQQELRKLRVLGKRDVPIYASDSDVPAIAGFSGILFSLAYYDMLCRDQRGEEGLSALNEAVGPNFLNPQAGQQPKPGGWLGVLVNAETVQQAHNVRIIPSHGFGDEHYYGWPFEGKSITSAN